MTDDATWTEKFDRWWAERKLHPVGDSLAIRETCRAAFLAGAAAERAEFGQRLLALLSKVSGTPQ